MSLESLFTASNLSLASTAVSGIGNVVAGIGGKSAAEYNARILEAQAASAREAGQLEAIRIRREGRKAAGAARAAAAASGVDVNTGSPLDVQLESLKQASIDATNAARRGDFKAWGFEAEAANQRWIGGNTLLTGFMGAGQSALKGLAKWKLIKSGAYNPLID